MKQIMLSVLSKLRKKCSNIKIISRRAVYEKGLRTEKNKSASLVSCQQRVGIFIANKPDVILPWTEQFCFYVVLTFVLLFVPSSFLEL